MKVLVTGGAGYVGSALLPRLLDAGHSVRVLDLLLYDYVPEPRVNLHVTRGDIRHESVVRRVMAGMDAVIHLACVSNDPSFELDPVLGRSINYDCFRPLVKIAKDSGVKLFIYASSSSVYGIKSEDEVTEDLPLKPLTDYSKYKAMCEDVLREEQEPGFATCIVRPATICGYAPRQRLDLIVNLLTNQAVNAGKIVIMGGAQKRPNLHIADMAEFYTTLLAVPRGFITRETFNVGAENLTVAQIAEKVRRVVPRAQIERHASDDARSYHISSAKAAKKLAFAPMYSVDAAIFDLLAAFTGGRLPNAFTDSRYFNVKRMQELKLQ